MSHSKLVGPLQILAIFCNKSFTKNEDDPLCFVAIDRLTGLGCLSVEAFGCERFQSFRVY